MGIYSRWDSYCSPDKKIALIHSLTEVVSTGNGSRSEGLVTQHTDLKSMKSTGKFLAAVNSAGVQVFARFLSTDMAALSAELPLSSVGMLKRMPVHVHW